ncbi:hypothetical protein Gorai_004466 [Gossypium raimondii]|uniref:Uncharacterized protein n=1 Tax=Gossypium raimondii TaxID=29730 RepID=A0A7J8QIA8_GOSRA|nr:hypothetical protein [Gossypium raimondii]
MEKSTGVTSSSGGDVRHSTKKVRRRPEEPPNPDDPILDTKGLAVNSSGGTKESLKDKLIGNNADGEKPQKENEDFELMEGDATNEVINGDRELSLTNNLWYNHGLQPLR